MVSDFELDRKNNVNQLKALIEKYMPSKKKFVINKIKNEQ